MFELGKLQWWQMQWKKYNFKSYYIKFFGCDTVANLIEKVGNVFLKKLQFVETRTSND